MFTCFGLTLILLADTSSPAFENNLLASTEVPCGARDMSHEVTLQTDTIDTSSNDASIFCPSTLPSC